MGNITIEISEITHTNSEYDRKQLEQSIQMQMLGFNIEDVTVEQYAEDRSRIFISQQSESSSFADIFQICKDAVRTADADAHLGEVNIEQTLQNGNIRINTN